MSQAHDSAKNPGRKSLEALAEEIVEAVYANEDSYTAVLKILQREAQRHQ